jgi:hypothetical protein
MNHAVAGCDSSALHDPEKCDETDWCAGGFECVDWRQKLRDGQEPKTEWEDKNFLGFSHRYTKLKERWEEHGLGR